MIKILDNIDIKILLYAYQEIENSIIWTNFPNGKQAGLQYKGREDPWSSAVGTSKGDDLESNLLNPFFANTLFEDIINTYKLKRTRLMWMSSKSCYSMHKDISPRIHIPIISDPQCFFVFRSGIIEHLSVGTIYWVDTTKLHTAMNGSDIWRLHLVGVVES